MTSVLYETACGHLRMANPDTINLAASFQCTHCATDTRITGVQVMEYKVSCPVPGCSYTRFTGMSRDLATMRARRHGATTGHYNVRAEFAANPAAVKERERIQKGKLL